MNANLAAVLYLVAGVLFILSLRGLSSPASSRRGNFLGMAGMAIAVVTTLAAHPPADGIAWVLVIVGVPNLAGRVAASASSLYARNLFSFIETLVDKSTKALAVNWDDELVKSTALTKDGAVIHPNFQPKSA